MIKFFAELRRRNVFRVCGTFVVASWFLVQTAFTLESVMNLPDWFDGLVMAVAMLGLPIVALLAWAFELTPEGFKRTEVVSAEESIAAQTGKRLDIAILIGLVAIGGFLVADRFIPSGATAQQLSVDGTSIAVLPFENRSISENDAFFADGIHDELLTTLSRIPGLEVISRTSVMGYRGTDKRVPEIATELGVGAVLEGAVQRSGDRVRITVQLIDGPNDRHIWAESYDRPLSPETIFDIQGEITTVIASSLKGVLISGEDFQDDLSTQNLEAYEAYLRGRLLTRPGEDNAEELRQAISAYEAAIAADPAYAQAWASKSYAQMALYWFHGRDVANREAGKLSLDQAQTLAPDILETHIAEAFYLYWGRSDYRGATAAFDRALRVAPGSVDAVAGQAFLIRRLGDFEGALEGIEKAHRLDPASYYLVPELALTHVLLGNFEAAEEFIEKARVMDPDSLQGHFFAAAVAQFSGQDDLAFEAFTPVASYAPYDYVNYALATQDPNKLRAALAVWPSSQKVTPKQKVNFALASLRAADLLDMPDTERATHLATLDALYDATAGWENPPYDYPVLVAAFLNKPDIVDALAAAYDDRASEDSITAIGDYSNLAESYMRLGNSEQTLKYIDAMVDLLTPDVFRVFRDDPLYEPLASTERWRDLAAQAQNSAP